MRPVTVAAFLITLGPVAAQAYPIFYKCDASGHVDDVLDSKDIREKVLALPLPTQADIDSKIAKICEDNAECFAILKQAFLLTQDTASAANELYEREVRKIEEKLKKIGDEIRVDSEVPEIAKNLLYMTDSVNECRQSQLRQPVADFVYKGHAASDTTMGYDVFVQHPVDNEYNSVTGLGAFVPDGNGGYKRVDQKTDYDHLATVIEDAVAGGVDPYMALAVAYLEAGRAEPFTLDPMPAMQIMGCPTRKLSTLDDSNDEAYLKKEAEYRRNGTTFFYNWGTFYAFDYGVSTSKQAKSFYAQMDDAKMRGILAEQGEILSDAPGFACVQNEGAFLTDQNGKVVESYDVNPARLSKSKACCMKIPYVSKRIFSIMANTALRDHLSSNSGDPAKDIQAFNGFGVIGLTEKAGVGAFRYGMRMRDQPQYGAQGMDFILNSFMSNPQIRQLVGQQEARYGKYPRNVICSGKRAGTYAVDSDKYIDMQKGMKRLATVIGKDWSALTGLEKGLVRHEYEFIIGLKRVDHPKLTPAQNERLQAAIDIFEVKGDEAAKWNYYRSTIYPLRDTLYKVSTKSWERFSDSEVLDMRQRILDAESQGH